MQGSDKAVSRRGKGSECRQWQTAPVVFQMLLDGLQRSKLAFGTLVYTDGKTNSLSLLFSVVLTLK